MSRYHLIKVVKRVEREQGGQEAAVGTPSELSAHEKARQMAVIVKEWISESRRIRLTEHQEIEQRLGWQRPGGHDQNT